MSEHQTVLIAWAVGAKLRVSRSAVAAAAGSATVVRLRRRLARPTMPWPAIKRATRLRETRRPRLRSALVMRGEP